MLEPERRDRREERQRVGGPARFLAASGREPRAYGHPTPRKAEFRPKPARKRPEMSQNRHLRYPYIAGLGAVASAATTKTPEGRPEMFLSGMPVEFAEGVAPESLRLSGSLMYIRSRPSPPSQTYVVINPTDSELAATFSASGQEGVDYPRGIRLNSLLRKLALAWHFRDANLLLASELTDDSRLLFRRSVVERVSRVTGNLLSFPDAPYPVVHDGHIVWMLEGFTGTRWFPLSRLYELMPRRPVRYVRNSVKITVDSKTGEMNLYVAELIGDRLEELVGEDRPPVHLAHHALHVHAIAHAGGRPVRFGRQVERPGDEPGPDRGPRLARRLLDRLAGGGRRR